MVVGFNNVLYETNSREAHRGLFFGKLFEECSGSTWSLAVRISGTRFGKIVSHQHEEKKI